jgi:predicted nuclease of predicted toxin-antitoxin system
MKFKLDENLGSRIADLIAQSGHDVATVTREKLSGASDARLFDICVAERRCLISLDLDFALDRRPTLGGRSGPYPGLRGGGIA